ncbi:MAG TPA: tetratricopeptide repeat protein [Candidatus Angelobacter sp.]|nr:tetratricopeptide repeat protein [Candidatus Angelobacter sp.]
MAEFAISGTTLRSRLQSGGLQTAEALAIGAEAGRALAQAHAAGRIHGNLTSASIVLQDSTAPKVTIEGFGREGPTAENVEHLAPERIAGGPPTIAADIYSFGRILEQIRSAATLDSTSDRQWDAAVHRCLDPIPDRRFSSVGSVLQAIGREQRTLSVAASSSTIEGLKRWGQFQLLQRLDAGGFGEVYRAWDLTLEREVALKLLLPRGLEPEEEFASIVSEARAMARVNHPNIVSVHGVDQHDGRVGLWSEFIRGQSLARWVETEGPRSEKETVEIGMALCDALSAVHHAGLLHRDIKPGNAMRAEDGRILLMDFGLSHELHQEPRWGGTLDYMAPELLAGRPPSVQSDIYAMGVLLKFLCSGNHQQSNSDMQQPTISSALRPVIDTATNVDPQQRYSSAAKLRDALAATLAGLPATAPARKKSLRTTVAWIAAFLVLCALTFLIPQVRRAAQARLAGTNRAAYEDYLAAEEALLRYDKPGNTQKAIDLYKRTLDRSPNFALAEAGLARADWRMYLDTTDKKWFDAAGQDAASAAAMNPNLAPVQMTLGMVHVEQRNVGLGTQELEQARQLDPRSGEVRAAIGEAYRVQGRLADAKNELQTAMDLAPDNWRWPYLLAALQIDSGDFKSAEANLRIALEKTPDNSRVLYNLGLVYRKQGKLEEAIKAYQDALNLDGSYFQAAVALANVLALQQHYDEALVMHKRAVEMRPGDWRTWGGLATAQEFTGRDPDEAVRDYRKAVELAATQLKITPDDPFLVSRLGRFYSSLHDAAHALPLLRKSLVLAPNDPDVVERVAEAYELLGDREQALKLISKALQLGFSVDYGKKTPTLKGLRSDPRAPLQLREAAAPQ